MQADFSWATNGGPWFQAYLAESVQTGDENCDSLLIVCSFVNNIIYSMLCFVKKAFERIMPYTLISHTKMSSVFGTGLFTDSIVLKASQTSKVYARFHEIANEPYMSSKYENTD